MVICLERGADLHMFQLMPLPLTVSCFSKIQIGFSFLVPAHLGSPGERAVKRVCVCVYEMFLWQQHLWSCQLTRVLSCITAAKTMFAVFVFVSFLTSRSCDRSAHEVYLHTSSQLCNCSSPATSTHQDSAVGRWSPALSFPSTFGRVTNTIAIPSPRKLCWIFWNDVPSKNAAVSGHC